MKALLVYPAFSESYWGFHYALPFIGKRAAMPPLPLATVAAMLPSNWEIEVVDENIERLTNRHLRWADICLFSAMTAQKESLFRSIARAHKAGVHVVVGGPFATSYRTEIEAHVPGMVDTFFSGECEATMPRFLEDLTNGSPKQEYAGPRFGKVILTKVTDSPTPRFDLLRMSAYAAMAVQWSRGCPRACEFCDITPMFGHVPRLKSPEQMLAELDRLYELGWRGRVFFVDDNFIGNKKELRLLLPALVLWQREHGYPFEFFTEASLELGDTKWLLEAMQEARFTMVFLGIESPNEEALQICDKGQNVGLHGESTRDSLLRRVATIQSFGIMVSGGFIVGMDGDTEFDSHITFTLEAGIPMAMAGLLGVLRGTDLWARMEREGRLLEDEHSGHNVDFVLNFKTKLPREEVLSGYRHVISTLYEPTLEHYFARAYAAIERLGEQKRGASPYGPVTAVRALALSLLLQGFSRQGPAYFRFLSKVRRTHPQHLALAVALAINGYHFQRITWKIITVHDFKNFLLRERELVERKIAELRTHCQFTRQPWLEQELLGFARRARSRFRDLKADARAGAKATLREFLHGLDEHARAHGLNLRAQDLAPD